MTDLLSVDTIFFTVLGYPMSYVEFFGTLLNLLSVWLTARNKVMSWPVGLAAVALFFLLFREIRLYSDMVEQAYFFFTGLWGWWAWTHPGKGRGDAKGALAITRASARERLIAATVTAFGTLALGVLMERVHLILPAVFTAPADYPYLDAFTTVLSFTATVLMVRKRLDCWTLWILVDVIGIWLYAAKGVRFIALEYVVFLILATAGLLKWRRLIGRGDATPAEPGDLASTP